MSEKLIVKELARRHNDKLTVTLWWIQGTMDTYVSVEDDKSVPPQVHRIDVVPPATPNDVFNHPFSYMELPDGN